MSDGDTKQTFCKDSSSFVFLLPSYSGSPPTQVLNHGAIWQIHFIPMPYLLPTLQMPQLFQVFSNYFLADNYSSNFFISGECSNFSPLSFSLNPLNRKFGNASIFESSLISSVSPSSSYCTFPPENSFLLDAFKSLHLIFVPVTELALTWANLL